MLGRIAHFKHDDDMRIKSRDAQCLKICAGIEHEAIRSRSERRAGRRQICRSAIGSSLAASDALPFSRGRAIERDAEAGGRFALRCVEHVCGDAAHEIFKFPFGFLLFAIPFLQATQTGEFMLRRLRKVFRAGAARCAVAARRLRAIPSADYSGCAV